MESHLNTEGTVSFLRLGLHNYLVFRHRLGQGEPITSDMQGAVLIVPTARLSACVRLLETSDEKW